MLFMFCWNKERNYKAESLSLSLPLYVYTYKWKLMLVLRMGANLTCLFISHSLFLLRSSEPIVVKWGFLLSSSLLSLQGKMYVDTCVCPCEVWWAEILAEQFRNLHLDSSIQTEMQMGFHLLFADFCKNVSHVWRTTSLVEVYVIIY